MYIDPDVQKLLADADPEAKDFWQLCPEEARAASDAMIGGMLPAVAVQEITELTIPTASGGVRARLYRPDSGTRRPLLVFFHGGGWEVGSLEVSDRPLRRLANDSGFAILSVGYRLAPEDPFPAALDDCFAATEWAHGHRDQLGAGGAFFAVGGDSAGGNLAAAVAQLSRDRCGPPLDYQLLVYPVVSPDFETESYHRFGEGYFLTRASMRSFWQLYLSARVSARAAPPYADLYAAGSLQGLPPATVLTCGLDPLRDEGEQYTGRLAEAGVPVTLVRAYGLLHGIWYMDALGERAYQFGADVAGVLRRAAARARSG